MPFTRTLALCFTLLATGLLVGCELIGAPFAAFDKEQGPQDVAARYTDLAQRKTAVLIGSTESTRYRFPTAVENLAATLNRALANNVEGIELTPVSQTLAYQKQNPFWSAVPPSQLLAALKVERLIVVDLNEYRVQEPGNQNLWRGVIDANVSVYEDHAPDPDDKTFTQSVRAEFPEGTTVGLVKGDPQTMQLGAMRLFVLRAGGLFFDHQE